MVRQELSTEKEKVNSSSGCIQDMINQINGLKSQVEDFCKQKNDLESSLAQKEIELNALNTSSQVI